MNAQRLWIIGGVFGAVIIVALGWFLGISPEFQQASAADAQYEASQQQEQTQQAALAALEKQYDGVDQLKAQLAQLQSALPAARNVSDFLRQLDALAKQNHVTLGSIGVSPATEFTAPAPAPAAPATPGATPAPTGSSTPAPTTAPAAPAPGATAAAGPKNLFSLPVNLTGTGSRAGLLDFVSALQNGDGRLFTVSNVSLNGSATGSGAGSAGADVVTGATGTGGTTGTATGDYSLTVTGAIYVMLPTQ